MRRLRASIVLLVLIGAGCAAPGGNGDGSGDAGPGGGGGGDGPGGGPGVSGSPGASSTATPLPPTAGGDGFHLELTYTYDVTLEVIAGAGGTTSGVDTFEGDLLPVETDATGEATRYEGTFVATATGSSNENVFGQLCEAEWAGEQELTAVGEVDGDEIDLTFSSASAPSYEVRTGEGDICPGVIDLADVLGGPLLPFNDAVVAAGVPVSLALPSEPGEQTIPITGTIAGARIDAEWHAVWSEPED